MNGVLVIDKPEGVTSHDVVALARRTLREKRIGHTGTLDPLATGVLPLAIGRATRLVRFFTASDKTYEAGIRFGVTTDTHDVTGTETGRTDRQPGREALEEALVALRGRYLQQPPPFSAKKVGGRRAYALARRQEAVVLTPVPVHVSQADIVDTGDGRATIRITCSAGFYVRAFAHALGERVGTGACLERLRRTRSGSFDLVGAVTVETLAAGDGRASERLIPIDRLLPGWPAVEVTDEGQRHVSHGRAIGPAQIRRSVSGADARQGALPASAGEGGDPEEAWCRVLDPGGRLIAVASASRGLLHPSIVLI